jgi:acyl-CoA synthetase (AMP-forming)/AMP-acid ligase II
MPTFSDYLKRHYQQVPEHVAMYLLHGGAPDRPVTYRDLVEGANGYVQTFVENGIHPGDVVLLILQHGIDLVHAYFGTVLHGAIPSIMPFLTEKLSPEHYRKSLESLFKITKPAVAILLLSNTLKPSQRLDLFRLFILDSRIQIGVKNIDKKINAYKSKCQNNNRPLNHWIISP